MNALSTLYLFSSTYSMTSANIVGAVSACPRTAAFLSVPYILKMLAEDTEGLKMLQRMELVSVGGAPLPELCESTASSLKWYIVQLLCSGESTGPSRRQTCQPFRL